ncbi:FAD-binding oxidoreductase [Xylanimonas ulmi]|uniref:FAD-binding oxidoreductase n=1 Tax=Xylanimonas ulmi TaxID=228973 RepID=UPI00102B1AFA|nr:FAD-dependent oxidoreductase [Xylanibacterium ulmi]
MTGLAVPASLRARAVEPGDRRWEALRSTYTTAHDPALVLLPRTSEEVADALVFAGGSGLPVSVRSGGHGLHGRSSNDGGIVVDLSVMDAIEVLDRDAGLVRLQAGARWGRVAERLARDGLAISSGDHGNVGVGGLATAGGIGWLTRTYGLTVDHVRAATVVLPDGRVVRTDPEHEPDLLWAVRGAGDSVGIVTDLDIEAMPLGLVGIGQVAVAADADVLLRWSQHLQGAPRDLTVNGLLSGSSGGAVLQMTAVVASDEPDRVRELLEPLGDLGGRVLGMQAQLAPYTALVSSEHAHANYGQQPAITTNLLLPTLTSDSAQVLLSVATHPARPFVQVRSLGGATHDVAPEESAFPHRSQNALTTLTVFPPQTGSELDEVAAPLRPFGTGAYRNFESRPDERTFWAAYPGATGERVLELRRRYDPEGVLRRLDAPSQPVRGDGQVVGSTPNQSSLNAMLS